MQKEFPPLAPISKRGGFSRWVAIDFTLPPQLLPRSSPPAAFFPDGLLCSCTPFFWINVFLSFNILPSITAYLSLELFAMPLLMNWFIFSHGCQKSRKTKKSPFPWCSCPSFPAAEFIVLSKLSELTPYDKFKNEASFRVTQWWYTQSPLKPLLHTYNNY